MRSKVPLLLEQSVRKASRMPIFVWIAIALAIAILAVPPLIFGAVAYSFLNGPAGYVIVFIIVGLIAYGIFKRRS